MQGSLKSSTERKLGDPSQQDEEAQSGCASLCSCFASRKLPRDRPRTFSFDRLENDELYESNYIKTTKYSLLTFLPLALLFQFKRFANIYFVFVAILQSIPALSALNPLTAWIPLILVLSLSLIREAFEDYGRYKLDKTTNNAVNYKYNSESGTFEMVKASSLNVGDFVLIQ